MGGESPCNGLRVPATANRRQRPSGRPRARTRLGRSDEIVWGRAPARLDLAGGWTDTPPYALERGGTVLNAAVLLNAQPPVHVYAVTPEPMIRVARSILAPTWISMAGTNCSTTVRPWASFRWSKRR